MKVSLDGGAVCTKNDEKFGNYTFTKNIIDALQRFDKSNEYYIYSFCNRPEWLRESSKFHYKVLRPKQLWLSSRVSIEEISQKKDLYLALNQAIPIKTSGEIISFSHGLSFHFFPDFYPDSYYALEEQLKPMIKRSKKIIVSSIKVKKELQKLFPKYSGFVVLNYGIPLDILPFTERKKGKVFLYVGMNHPIKNLDFIISAFIKIRKDKKFLNHMLYLAGNLKKYEDHKNNIFVFEGLTRQDISKLYANAAVYLSASFYESFNFPVLEALSRKCSVVGLTSAIIPEFRKYVYLAKDLESFVSQAKIAATREISNKVFIEIRKKFTWKKYVAKLRSLYD